MQAFSLLGPYAIIISIWQCSATCVLLFCNFYFIWKVWLFHFFREDRKWKSTFRKKLAALKSQPIWSFFCPLSMWNVAEMAEVHSRRANIKTLELERQVNMDHKWILNLNQKVELTKYDVYTMDPEDGKSTHKGLSAPEEIATNGAIHVHATAASSGNHKWYERFGCWNVASRGPGGGISPFTYRSPRPPL